MIARGSSVRGLSLVTIGEIGVARHGAAHLRALGRIAIAAAAEHADQPPRVSGRSAAITRSSASGVCA